MAKLQPDWLGKTLPVSITKAQVSNRPSIDSDKPVASQNEAQYHGYCGYRSY